VRCGGIVQYSGGAYCSKKGAKSMERIPKNIMAERIKKKIRIEISEADFLAAEKREKELEHIFSEEHDDLKNSN